jgi:hypothetical protein
MRSAVVVAAPTGVYAGAAGGRWNNDRGRRDRREIQIVPGQGMPSFELKHGVNAVRVFLGPMPFLIERNFNLKAGQDVVVKGYELDDRILAVGITLVAERRTVKFRDAQGWPLWRGGFGRGRGR